MYEIIEKNFKKNNPYKKYEKGYWAYYFILVVIFNLLNIIFKINNWLLAFITFLIFLISIFIFIYCTIKKSYGNKKFKKHGFIKLLKVSVQNLNSKITDSLIATLKKNNINSKDKIRVLIDYYIKKEPASAKASFTSIIADLFVTIASIVVIAYNGVTNRLNTDIIVNVLYYSFIITMMMALFTFTVKYIFRGIFPEKEYYNSTLLDELTYIYMNFEKYENKFR